jgi:hypothetical protein
VPHIASKEEKERKEVVKVEETTTGAEETSERAFLCWLCDK